MSLGLAKAAGWSVLDHPLARFRYRISCSHRGLDKPRGYRVYKNSVLDDFKRHRLGERNYPTLGGTVMRREREASRPSNRSDVDDAAGLFWNHDLERFAPAVESGVKMGREHLMPVIVGIVNGGEQNVLVAIPRASNPGIVDKNVNGTECGKKIGEHLFDGCATGDVGNERTRDSACTVDFGGNVLSSLKPHIVDPNLGSSRIAGRSRAQAPMRHQ